MLLSADFPGRNAVAEQVAVASVRAIDNNGSLEFAPSDKSLAEVVRRIPVEAELDDGDGVTIHVLLHVVDGLLRELEVYRDDSGRVQRALVPDDLASWFSDVGNVSKAAAEVDALARRGYAWGLRGAQRGSDERGGEQVGA